MIDRHNRGSPRSRNNGMTGMTWDIGAAAPKISGHWNDGALNSIDGTGGVFKTRPGGLA